MSIYETHEQTSTHKDLLSKGYTHFKDGAINHYLKSINEQECLCVWMLDFSPHTLKQETRVIPKTTHFVRFNKRVYYVNHLYNILIKHG